MPLTELVQQGAVASEKKSASGWTVVAAGTGINLTLGILYAWSVLKGGLPHDWSATEKSLPYAVACLMFSISSVPAGKLQDRIGPRWVAAFGGLLTSLGLVVVSQLPSVTGYVLGFGVLAGMGIGLGYASATPPAVKWFPGRTGLVTGIVVAGFGLASAYISPLVTYLLKAYRPEGSAADVASAAAISKTMLTLGVAFFVVTTVLSQLLRNPPVVAPKPGASAKPGHDYAAGEMLRTPQFYLLWTMFLFAAGAGLMVISTMSQLTKAGAEQYGFLLVALLALGNAGGRIAAGVLSDKIGQTRTMTIVFLFQAVLMFALIKYQAYPLMALILVAILVGANYGANLSVFPSVVKAWFGLKNFGFNYGLVFTSWGIGGFLLSFLLAGKIKDWTGSYTLAFIIAGSLLVVAAGLTFVIKPPKPREAQS